jgi:hypothetical protein
MLLLPPHCTSLPLPPHPRTRAPGNPVSTDGSSAGYKKFADKVKALAQV